MSGGTTATWLLGAAAAAGTAATIDANKSAQHQQRVQRRINQENIDEATRLETQKLEQADRLAKEQLGAQARAQSASIAQAQRAQAESKAMMDKQLKAADESLNRASQKRPNTARIVDEASQAGKAGASGTMLTGPTGVDSGSLQLGRSTLLGA